ncbi:DNA-binding response regulator [Bifidobacterium ramosum]|uniref:Response regulator n=1 Tax=Bifidobacterium ramosum TaxID=1798158 RepID=A0A6L4WXJ7_9BIFI|nr:LytTR family DNA-binding domain-containing protein [Bifidobacterium ramosum]KAB8286628.1 DNA-binding response regulator [Bifidobacterium ramosum]NEG72809.1 response regulator [Bifidobacterium ramosum]
MFTVAMVEDDENAAERLRGCLTRYERDHAGVAFDVTEFREPTGFLEPYRASWDIVFMDIEMPNMDGMQAARRLRELDSETILIFVTNMAQFAAKGYEVDALDYIIKPFSYPDFERKLTRALKLAQADGESLLVSQRGSARRIALRDISYIEIRAHNLEYHTDSGTISAYGSLQDIEARLSGSGFIRCGKPYLVSSRHIAQVAGDTVTLTDGTQLPIGRAYRKSFLLALAENLGNDRVR